MNQIRVDEPSVSTTSNGASVSDAQAWVDRRSDLSRDEFDNRYLKPRLPVVITDAAREWPLYEKATPEWFKQHHGDLMLNIHGQERRLGDLIEQLEASTLEKPGPYPCKFDVAVRRRELLPELSPRFDYSLPDRQASALVPQRLFGGVNNLEIFFGGPGGQFPYLHYDVLRLHAWITQLHGDKEFTLYAPDQEHLLYVNPKTPWQSAIRNHHAPDYERYPLFREAVKQTVTLRPGETLFLPCGWWHTARSLTMTISVAFDQLGPDNWSDFIGDVVDERVRAGSPIKARMIGAVLSAMDPLLTSIEARGGNRPTHWGSR